MIVKIVVFNMIVEKIYVIFSKQNTFATVMIQIDSFIVTQMS